MSYRGASVVFSSPYIGVRARGVLLEKRNYFTIDLSLPAYLHWRVIRREGVESSKKDKGSSKCCQEVTL